MAKKDLPRPFGDRLLVRRDATEEKSKGGILMPEAAKRESITGVVLDVGEGRFGDSGFLHEIPLAAGDRVVFSAYGATEIEHGGEKLLLVGTQSIMAVLP